MFLDKKGFSIVELVVSVVILSIFLILSYKTIDNFAWVINYIDSNIVWLNMTKVSVDEVVNLRNKFFLDYPYDGWEKFLGYYWTGTFKLSKDKCSVNDELNSIYLCKTIDNKSWYEWPIDINWNITTDKNGLYFYKKIDLDEYNKFYLKTLSRVNSWSIDKLIFKFSDSIYNKPSLLLNGDFENKNLSIENSWLDLDYYDLNWNTSDENFSNLNNYNLRYSKILRYNTWSSISDRDYLKINFSSWSYKFLFYTVPPTLTWTWVIPIKIDSDINKNYYNLCSELNKIDILSCDFNLIIQDNFYKKLIWFEKDISNIDFWDDFSFAFSWANNDELILTLSWNILPENKTWLYINPYLWIKHNNDTSNENNFLALISDSTAWLWVEIPERPWTLWWINTSTWFTSLYSIKATTILYDKTKYIDTFVISSKIWDINRYQDYYEEK